MKQLSLILAVGSVLFAAAPAMAQQQTSRDSARKAAAAAIPVDARPPKGMCRIWINGVPAAQQPAVTDCATAVKNLPPNARVIFGDDYADSAKTKSGSGDKGDLPPTAKGFTGVKPAVIIRKPPK
jgi:hypothetical protein